VTAPARLSEMLTVLWDEDDCGPVKDTCGSCGLGLVHAETPRALPMRAAGISGGPRVTLECYACWIRVVAFRRSRRTTSDGPDAPTRTPGPDSPR
jgi:hypothetical protein